MIFNLLLLLIFLILLCSSSSLLYFFNYSSKDSNGNKLFYSTEDFPELKILEDNWRTIQSEIPTFNPNAKMIRRGRYAWNNKEGEELYDQLKENKEWVRGWMDGVEWYQFPLMYHGEVIGNAEKMCPRTVSLLKGIPNINIAGYALLRPDAKLNKHQDEAGRKNGSMAANMEITGKKSSLYVCNGFGQFKQKDHSSGQMVIFDSTNTHYAENNDKDNRVILYVELSLL